MCFCYRFLCCGASEAQQEESSLELHPAGPASPGTPGPQRVPTLPLPLQYHLRQPTPPPCPGPPPTRPLPALPIEHRAEQSGSSKGPLFCKIRGLPRCRAYSDLRARFLVGGSSSSSTHSTVDHIISAYDNMEVTHNELLSSVKSSDLSLKAQLHPLVLMDISNHITSHTQRKQQGPIVGCIIGQQNGREITLEFIFEAHATPAENGDLIIPGEWLATRLEQMKLVHKDLDLVGWYTLMAQTGPRPNILPIHHQILSYNESAVVLGLHTDALVNQAKDTAGGKIPVTVYESYYEVDDASKITSNSGEDKEMKDGDATLKLKFRVIPHSFTTDEAEMISMDYIAGGAGNAASAEVKEPKTASAQVDVKGKRRAAPQDAETFPTPENVVLSKEDEEAVAALTGKMNATKMMKSRVDLAASYLEQLPPSVLRGEGVATAGEASGQHTTPSHTILRQVQSMTDRLKLLEPSDLEQFNREMMSEANDVRSIAMLDEMATAISDMRDVGKKHHIVESAKNQNRRMATEFGSAGGSSGFNLPGAGDLL